MMQAYIDNLHWQSDWNGYEVGFPEYNVVGLYSSPILGCDFYVDAETGRVLEVMKVEDDL